MEEVYEISNSISGTQLSPEWRCKRASPIKIIPCMKHRLSMELGHSRYFFEDQIMEI